MYACVTVYQLNFRVFRACLQLQISFGLGPGFVGPFTTLHCLAFRKLQTSTQGLLAKLIKHTFFEKKLLKNTVLRYKDRIEKFHFVLDRHWHAIFYCAYDVWYIVAYEQNLV